MYIDTSHITRGGKTYTRHLLRESYRANGKVLHRTIANVSHCSEAEIEAMRLALRVAYLLSAGNISTPLLSRLGRPYQPVINL